MRRFLTLGLIMVVAIGLVRGDNGKDGKEKHTDEHVVVKPADIKWGPAPPGLPPGAEAAVLSGDPSKAGGLYTLRAKLPDGYVVPPHWHGSDENVTVLKGTLLIGKGMKLEADHFQELTVGSFMRMPKEMRHYAKAKGETIIQVHGVGPFDITYVNAADDPRKKK